MASQSKKIPKQKRMLTQAEEFEVLKLVLDKFLWVGFAIMVFGLFNIFQGMMTEGLIWIGVGAIVLILFIVIIVREFEMAA